MTREPNPDQARASLSDAARARDALVIGTKRSAWIDAVSASGLGIVCGLMVRHSVGEMIAAAVLFTLVVAGLILVQARSTRRRGRIFDERSVGASAKRYAVFYVPFAISSLVRPPDEWWPWYSIGVGLLIAGLGFAYLRLDERYQTRRLAQGDYGRHDLV